MHRPEEKFSWLIDKMIREYNASRITLDQLFNFSYFRFGTV